ncbi:MAG: hypothetical protein EZS28_008474 [Streblomastix strix]|uniref:Uncharacterized protein n=1 Tax=Streblomastix strix TaxID=222440 RepID=A0A5J4WLZ5_9EUKA|nr:MAG: hypothetical protein EZS28_008474 [Streblomastix strix]
MSQKPDQQATHIVPEPFMSDLQNQRQLMENEDTYTFQGQDIQNVTLQQPDDYDQGNFNYIDEENESGASIYKPGYGTTQQNWPNQAYQFQRRRMMPAPVATIALPTPAGIQQLFGISQSLFDIPQQSQHREYHEFIEYKDFRDGNERSFYRDQQNYHGRGKTRNMRMPEPFDNTQLEVNDFNNNELNYPPPITVGMDLVNADQNRQSYPRRYTNWSSGGYNSNNGRYIKGNPYTGSYTTDSKINDPRFTYSPSPSQSHSTPPVAPNILPQSITPNSGGQPS